MIFLELIPKPVMLALIAALLALSGWLYVSKSAVQVEAAQSQAETELVRKEHATQVADAAKAVAQNIAFSRTKELILQQTMDKERQDTNEKITLITHDRDAIKLRLIQYVEKTRGDTSGPSLPPHTRFGQTANNDNGPRIPAPSTGASDAIGGLIDEAARADEIRVAYLGCVRSYDAVAHQ